MAEQNHDPQEQRQSLQAPEKLVDALNQLQKDHIFVPATVDRAVLRAAGEHLRRLERPPSPSRAWASWAAMAACLALAAWLGERHNSPFAREDITRDGRVDVLDAFALARRIDSGGPLDPRWDINGDGRVDRADINAIAARAVRLARAEPAPKRSANSNPHRAGEITVWQTEVRAPFASVPARSADLPAFASSFRAVVSERGGDEQSAVSPNCIRPAVESLPRPDNSEPFAGSNSAIWRRSTLRCDALKTHPVFYRRVLSATATGRQHGSEDKEAGS